MNETEFAAHIAERWPAYADIADEIAHRVMHSAPGQVHLDVVGDILAEKVQS